MRIRKPSSRGTCSDGRKPMEYPQHPSSIRSSVAEARNSSSKRKFRRGRNFPHCPSRLYAPSADLRSGLKKDLSSVHCASGTIPASVDVRSEWGEGGPGLLSEVADISEHQARALRDPLASAGRPNRRMYQLPTSDKKIPGTDPQYERQRSQSAKNSGSMTACSAWRSKFASW